MSIVINNTSISRTGRLRVIKSALISSPNSIALRFYAAASPNRHVSLSLRVEPDEPHFSVAQKTSVRDAGRVDMWSVGGPPDVWTQLSPVILVTTGRRSWSPLQGSIAVKSAVEGGYVVAHPVHIQFDKLL